MLEKDQDMTECSHHLQASHFTRKDIKTARKTARELMLASGLDRPNEKSLQMRLSHDSTGVVQDQEISGNRIHRVRQETLVEWSEYEGKEKGSGCRGLTNWWLGRP